jgi:hypothetical protein
VTAQQDGTPAAGRTGYRVVLPPGWVRIPLRDGAEQAIDAVLEPKFAGLPADRYGPVRAELRKRLMAQVQTARRNEGIDLYLPVEQIGGVTVAASVVVGLLRFSTLETPSAEDVLVLLAADGEGARLTELDGAGAVRTDRVEPGQEGREDEHAFGSRRVDYVTAIPDDPDAWLSISFSTVADGDPSGPVADLLVELFDAIVGTFRWVRG